MPGTNLRECGNCGKGPLRLSVEIDVSHSNCKRERVYCSDCKRETIVLSTWKRAVILAPSAQLCFLRRPRMSAHPAVRCLGVSSQPSGKVNPFPPLSASRTLMRSSYSDGTDTSIATTTQSDYSGSQGVTRSRPSYPMASKPPPDYERVSRVSQHFDENESPGVPSVSPPQEPPIPRWSTSV